MPPITPSIRILPVSVRGNAGPERPKCGVEQGDQMHWVSPGRNNMVSTQFVSDRMIAWLAANGVVRGIVSGLGLLNIWIAVSDAIEYREP